MQPVTFCKSALILGGSRTVDLTEVRAQQWLPEAGEGQGKEETGQWVPSQVRSQEAIRCFLARGWTELTGTYISKQLEERILKALTTKKR